jgi:hypothetical protein
VHRSFEICQGLEPQNVVQPFGQAGPYARHRRKQRYRIRLPSQSIEQCKMPVAEKLTEGASDSFADIRKRFQARQSARSIDFVYAFPRGANCCCRSSVCADAERIGALIAKEARHFLQSSRDLLIERVHLPVSAS